MAESKSPPEFLQFIANQKIVNAFDEKHKIPPNWFTPTSDPVKPFLYNFPPQAFCLLTEAQAEALVKILRDT